jgi:hypothetical protein
MLEALLEAGQAADGWFYPTFDRFAELATEQWRRLRVPNDERWVTFVMAGWWYDDDGGRHLVFGHVRYNAETGGFQAKAGASQWGFVLPFGATDAVSSKDRGELIAAARAGAPPDQIVARSVRLIRRAARSPVGEAIGEACSSIIVPADPSALCPVRFHGAVAGGRQYYTSEIVVTGDTGHVVLDPFFDPGAPPSQAD